MNPVLLVDSLDDIGDSADTATRYCWRSGIQVAVAARFGLVGLVNPADSGVRLILEGFLTTLSASGVVSAGLGATVAGTIAQGRFRDGGPGVPAGQIENDDTAGVTVDDVTSDFLSRGVMQPWEIVVQPGDNFRVQCNVANVINRTVFLWKEIKLPTVV